MNRAVQLLTGVLLGVLAGLYAGQCIRARADHIWPPILPSPQGGTVANNLTPVMQRVLSRGYVTYAFDVASEQYPGFQQQAADVAIASAYAIGFGARDVTYTGEQVDIWLTMPADATFISTCGSGAAACILYYNDPIIVYFRRALLYVDWRSTIGHEGLNDGHAMGQHERYDDINFRCITNPDPPTVMSCGSGIKYPTVWDRDVIWQILVPDLPSASFTLSGGGYIWVAYNGLRADGGAAHWGEKRLNNATRVEVWYRDAGFGWAYTGYDGPAVSGSNYASRGFGVVGWCAPYREFGVRPTNAALGGIPLVSGDVKLAGGCTP